jgi:FMN phosphatase YigB (HAD superfamily)
MIKYICDNKRHLVCIPYSIENLHTMARDLGINVCWFHKNHYDIPKNKIKYITSKCEVVSPKDIVRIIKGIKTDL